MPNAISRRWKRWQDRRRALNEQPYLELKRIGVVDYFRSYPRKAIKPQWQDLHGIYLLTMQRKPEVIVELGGGYSTFVFAHAIRELTAAGHKATFWSVDESPFWQQVVKERMPPELLPFVKFWHSPPTMTEIDGLAVAKFEQLPVDRCNFVYVDGGLPPGHTRGAGADAYLLESNAPPDYAVLVDGRRATCDFLRQKLRHNYSIGTNPHGVQTLFVRS